MKQLLEVRAIIDDGVNIISAPLDKLDNLLDPITGYSLYVNLPNGEQQWIADLETNWIAIQLLIEQIKLNEG